MVKVAPIGGAGLVVAGAALTLRGWAGWGFLALAVGFALAMGPLVKKAFARYGGALAAAVMTLALLLPLAPKPVPGGRPEPAPTSTATPPGPRPEGSPPPAEAGAGEEVRRAIFRDLVAAEERAKREAYSTHPDRDPGSAAGSDAERAAKRVEKRMRLARLLGEQYRAEIAARYSFPEESLDSILEEGKRQGWGAAAP